MTTIYIFVTLILNIGDENLVKYSNAGWYCYSPIFEGIGTYTQICKDLKVDHKRFKNSFEAIEWIEAFNKLSGAHIERFQMDNLFIAYDEEKEKYLYHYDEDDRDI